MNRYINADFVIEKINQVLKQKDNEKHSIAYFAFEKFKEMLEIAPTADVVEVRHGEWVKVMNHRECSICGYNAPYKKIKAGYHLQDLTKHCPNCGAKMDGERKEE